MKRIHLTILLITVLSDYAIGQEYVLSRESEIKFTVKHMGVFNVNGEFTEFSGKLFISEGNLSGEGTIVVNSVDTGNKSRDKDLRGEGFLDISTFPEMKFGVLQTYTQDEKSMMKGVLTIKDKSLDIIFPYEIVPTDRGILIEFETTIDRTDFELNFDSLDGLVGNEVKLYSYLLFEPGS